MIHTNQCPDIYASASSASSEDSVCNSLSVIPTAPEQGIQSGLRCVGFRFPVRIKRGITGYEPVAKTGALFVRYIVGTVLTTLSSDTRIEVATHLADMNVSVALRALIAHG
jgi:hypothetical protein